jgi:oxygen-independent coproporphyrinogen-3 oxidase
MGGTKKQLAVAAPTDRNSIEADTIVRHLYVHIPFCHHICPYCSFYKHKPTRGALADRAFVDALLAELDHLTRSPFDLTIRPTTIYFGGGTPSLLSTTLQRRLLDGFAERLDFTDLREWTVEANPATFDIEKIRTLLAGGVTRISLGVQSWSPETLATLGRDHSPAEAEAAFHILRDAEVPAVNVDLMFSIPGESEESWNRTLDHTIELQPDHISAYNLNYEEDTEFFDKLSRGEFVADEDCDANSFHSAIDRLTDAGFRHYEISNYARPGFESQHNRAYWGGADYLGIGPGAVSTVNGKRWTNLPDTAAYVAAIDAGTLPHTAIEELTRAQRRTEAIGLQLRTSDGLDSQWLANGDGNSAAASLQPLLDEGLVEWSGAGDRLILTTTGKPLVDSIAAHLL